MKSMMPWFCLVTLAHASSAFANDGLDAYRVGDYNKAAALLTAQSQDPVADYYMARMRLYGYGQLKNNTLAIRDFKRAAEKGFLPAQRVMARYELLENHNPEQALTWFKRAADANDVASQMYCASAYLFGVGAKKNADLARRYYIAAARNGNSIAQYTLAENFLEAHQSASKKLGLLWLDKAVAQKNPEAQIMLAELYVQGTLMPKDIAKAKELTNQAIAQGYIPAYYQMGQIEHSQNNIPEAQKWYQKAADVNFAPAEIALSQLYTDTKSPTYNAPLGLLWMIKAAQSGSKTAQLALVEMYKKGIGTAVDENLAAEWQRKAAANDTAQQAEYKAVQWLTNGKLARFADTQYRMRGIFNSWHNPSALRENNYNQSPQFEEITRDALYQPQFVMTNPTHIQISDYYDALVATKQLSKPDKLDFPRYLMHDKQLGAEKINTANDLGYDYLTHFAENNTSTDYKEVFKKLENQAILGDAAAQFDLGQMYQYGIGVDKNIEQAIKYYQLAAGQQDLPAEYNLGLLYLEGNGITPDYKLAVEWLNDAAFKGNPYAQYALARIYDQGYRDTSGAEVIAPDHEQAIAMYNLAASNNYGLGQFYLAEVLVREKQLDMSAAGKAHRNQLIKGLYQGAATAGVEQAKLPLAFYNAMDKDPAKQQLAFEAASKAADEDNIDAALLVGLMYDQGIATTQDHDEAIKWYKKAAVNPVGAFILGTYTYEGDGVSKDLEKGQTLLQQAADKAFSYANLNLAVLKHQQNQTFLPELEEAIKLGNATASLLLADYYLSLAKDTQQMKQARDIYQGLADKGDKDGQLKLAFLYEKGLGGPVDYANAHKWYTQAAEQGEPKAQYLLARFYQLGKLDNKTNYDTAKKWYAAAQTSYTPAAVALGFIYDTVDDNYQLAFANYQRAAEQNDVVGMFNLGLLYERGEGRPVDFDKARELYLQAANLQHPESMVQLAGLYLNGQGGSTDEDEAFEWYKKAADLGSSDALYQLGLLTESDVGTKLNYMEAVGYYQKAADKGNAKAILALARMHQHGIGIPQNTQEAMKLYNTLPQNSYAQYQLALLCSKDSACQAQQGKQWLQKAQENGSVAASNTMQWNNAQTQQKTSFVTSARVAPTVSAEKQSVELMYLDALNAWNSGDEQSSKAILARLLDKDPDYALAKKAYDQLVSVSVMPSKANSTQNTALAM